MVLFCRPVGGKSAVIILYSDLSASSLPPYTTNVQDVEFVLHLSGGCLCKLRDGNALTDDAGGGDLAACGGCAIASGVGQFGDQTVAA